MKMCKFIPVGSALALLLAAAAPAFALTVTPPGLGKSPIPFSAKGSTVLSKSGLTIGCTALLAGMIDGSGDMKITSAAFSGNSICKLVVATATAEAPWTGNIESPTQLAFSTT